MKVAFVLGQFPSLYNSFTVNEILALVERGIDVRIFALWLGPRNIYNEGADKLRGRTKFFLDLLPYGTRRMTRWGVRGLSKVERLSPFFKTQIAFPVAQSLYGKRDWFELYGEIRWNAPLLKRGAESLIVEGFDFIHASFGNAPATAAMGLSRISGIPFSLECHAHDLFVDFPRAARKLASAKAVFTISEYNRTYLCSELGCSPEKIKVMRVPIDKIGCEGVLGEERTANRVVAACRLHPIKGLSVAIDAIAKLVGQFDGLEFRIIGGGPLKEQLEQQVQQLGLEGVVRLVGPMAAKGVLREVASASVFLLPCVVAGNGDRDGIPTALMEAMYLETPVVASRVSGIPELIEDGRNGVLTEEGDVDGVAGAIRELLADVGMARELGRKGRERVVEFHRVPCESVLIDTWEELRKV